MIIRIMSEGQYRLGDGETDALNELDETLLKAVDGGDEAAFKASLATLLERVRAVGDRLPDDELAASDFVLPSADSTLEEVRDLLGEEGLIPG